MNPTATLIVTTYNWPEALELCLLSIQQQTVFPDEVIIADDGSKEQTKNLITTFQKNFPTKLIHVWHEDTGFRLSEIRNKAILAAKNAYIIQIDGDIILHKHFVKDHLKLAKKNTFLTGSRVWLSKKISAKAQQTEMVKFQSFSPELTNKINGFYIPVLTQFLKAPTQNIYQAMFKVRGCNMSFWKIDLEAVNGYDEEIVGWGREDSDIAVRLMNYGVTKERIKFGAIQYHQYHELNSRSAITKNDQILNEAIKSKRIKCKQGLYK